MPCSQTNLWYEHEKSLMFEAVLGPYTDKLLQCISVSNPGIVDMNNEGALYNGPGVAEYILDFVAESVELQASRHVFQKLILADNIDDRRSSS